MNVDIFKNNRFNKISRNGIIENDKHSIIKKFGFLSSFMSTSVQSKTKSFIEENKNTYNEISYKKNNKIVIKKNNSESKALILKRKTIKKIKPISKEDFSIKKCQNIFSYAQKMNFKTDNMKKKIHIISKDLSNPICLKKNLSQHNNLNNTNTLENNNKIKNRIRSIIFTQSGFINNKNRKKIESYENNRNKNYKLKYKFLFNKIKIKENNNYKNNLDSNTITIQSDANSVSTKKEKFSIFNNDQIFDDNIFNIDSKNEINNNNENDIENYYIINNKYSSENFSDKYNIKKYNIVEPCKTFNLVEESNENFCQFDQDISEKRSNDNNNEKNSNLINNNIHNNNIGIFPKKENEIYNINFFKKYSNLLKNTDSCNISPRNDLNELSKIKNNEPYEKNYKLISDIQNENEKFPILNINSFINLKDDSLFRLMGFIYDYYSILIKTNSLISSKIKNCFHNIFCPIINNFSKEYSSFLKVINYYFENTKLIINKKPVNTFNLIIICRVITKDVNKSYDISYNYISNNKEYDNLWKIDILKKSKIKLWLHTELFKINNCPKKFTYSSQISSFSFGDEIKFEINIFNQKNQLNPNSIQWLPPVITQIENNIFEANKFISNSKFDPLRCCEIEIQTLIWEEISINNNNNILIKEFLKIFEKNFIVEEFYKYTSKHIFYKIKMIANKKGIFYKNKFLFFDLNIIDYEEPLKNEIQPIYLMNSNYYTKKLDVRVGTIIFFYITEINS